MSDFSEVSLRRAHPDDHWIETELWEVGHSDSVMHFITEADKDSPTCRRITLPLSHIKHPVQRARLPGQRYTRTFVTMRRGIARLHGLRPLA